MTTGGMVAFVTLLVTYLGTLIGSWVAISNLRHSVAKEHANRRIALEEYADEVGRYHRKLRGYLLELADAGVIDMRKVDLTQFPPPPAPKYNGN